MRIPVGSRFRPSASRPSPNITVSRSILPATRTIPSHSISRMSVVSSFKFRSRAILVPDSLSSVLPSSVFACHSWWGSQSGSPCQGSVCTRPLEGVGWMPSLNNSRCNSIRPRLVIASADGNKGSRFPFNPEDYVKVSLRRVDLGPGDAVGSLIFQKDESSTGEIVGGSDERALVMVVGGDTLLALLTLLQGQRSKRPLSIDLLWEILERLGQNRGTRDAWQVLRIAVIGTAGNAYIGRIFFGHADGSHGESMTFDFDARPSDATWLALKSNAPMFVAKKVWESCSVNLGPAQRNASDDTSWFYEEPGASAGATHRLEEEHWTYGYAQRHTYGAGEGMETGGDSSANILATMTKIRPHDPEPLKRLKMEFKLALQDENFEAAARIRDHPFMLLHIAAQAARKDGDIETARRFEDRLLGEILRVEQQSLTIERDDQHDDKGMDKA